MSYVGKNAVFVLGVLVVLAAFNSFVTFNDIGRTDENTVQQLGENVSERDLVSMKQSHVTRNNFVWIGNLLIVGLGGLGLYMKNSRTTKIVASLFFLSMFTGCYRPFEPIKLETIQPFEEGFLIPFNMTPDKQQSSHTEDFLKKNLVYTQQVKIPQQWVQLGYNWGGYNGEWRDAAILIKVDKSPVTREWTADASTGTSDKNEAIWVMTSDQVEFSTGWTCTARIASREDSIKFLANYPNGSLEKVLDKEVRGKLQATFGLAVTDRPMDELRKGATPHIQSTVNEVIDYFKERGITILNLGITGGFVYKDPKIIETMVKLFNSEQDKEIAKQKAEALLTERKAEADGIKLVADAKKYESDMIQAQPELYLQLKYIELQKIQFDKWDGSFPQYLMGGNGSAMNMLFQVPELKK